MQNCWVLSPEAFMHFPGWLLLTSLDSFDLRNGAPCVSSYNDQQDERQDWCQVESFPFFRKWWFSFLELWQDGNDLVCQEQWELGCWLICCPWALAPGHPTQGGTGPESSRMVGWELHRWPSSKAARHISRPSAPLAQYLNAPTAQKCFQMNGSCPSVCLLAISTAIANKFSHGEWTSFGYFPHRKLCLVCHAMTALLCYPEWVC